MQSAHPAATELRSQLASLHVPVDRTTRVALRVRVSRYVDETKRLGWTPQRVIVAVKQIAHDAGLSRSGGASIGITTASDPARTSA